METITCLWVQSELDEMSEKCIRSWLKLGYDVNLYTYSKTFTNNISTKLHIKNAREIYDIEDDKIVEPYTHLADVWRFTLLKLNKIEKERIIYMDTDIVLLRNLPTQSNYVSSQYTQQTGAFKCKRKIVANIGVMCLDGTEDIDYDKILNCKGKRTIYQSKYLKEYEKQMKNLPDLIVDPNNFCPIHWGWAKDLFTKHLFVNQCKWGINQFQLADLLQEDNIYGIHLWRALKKGKNIGDTKYSIYNQIFNHLDISIK